MAKRSDIMQLMISRFTAIPAFVTVTRGRDLDNEPFGEEEVPALNLDDGDAKNAPDVSFERHALKVEAQIVLAANITNETVEGLMQDVLDAVALDARWKDATGASVADGSTFTGHAIGRSTTGDTVLRGTINLVVNYTAGRWKI